MVKDALLCGRQMIALCVQVPLVYRNNQLCCYSLGAYSLMHSSDLPYLTHTSKSVAPKKTLRNNMENPNISAAGQDAFVRKEKS